MIIQPNKAIVGANAFAHESGIHQDGMLKNKLTYEIMDAESIGLAKNELVLGKHSGRHAFRSRLTELGYDLNDSELNKAFVRFKVCMYAYQESSIWDKRVSFTETYPALPFSPCILPLSSPSSLSSYWHTTPTQDLADKKKEITNLDLESIVNDEIRLEHDGARYELLACQVVCGDAQVPTATIKVLNKETNQEVMMGKWRVMVAKQGRKNILTDLVATLYTHIQLRLEQDQWMLVMLLSLRLLVLKALSS